MPRKSSSGSSKQSGSKKSVGSKKAAKGTTINPKRGRSQTNESSKKKGDDDTGLGGPHR